MDKNMNKTMNQLNLDPAKFIFNQDLKNQI